MNIESVKFVYLLVMKDIQLLVKFINFSAAIQLSGYSLVVDHLQQTGDNSAAEITMNMYKWAFEGGYKFNTE